ncbi:MAG: caspase family protein [Bacteroidales bacterium]|nr:caspase family protein [Bacteroidales bacterium]
MKTLILILLLFVIVPSKAQKMELIIPTGHGNDITGMSFSGSGQWLVSGSRDKSIKIWNLKTGSELKTLQGINEEINCVRISPDGSKIISSSNGRFMLWEVSTGELIQEFNMKKSFGTPNRDDCGFTPDGRQFYIADMSTIDFYLVQKRTVTPEISIKLDAIQINGIHFSPDGKLLFVAEGLKITAFNLYQSGKQEMQFSTGTSSADILSHSALSPDGKTLAVTYNYQDIGKKLTIFDTETGQSRDFNTSTNVNCCEHLIFVDNKTIFMDPNIFLDINTGKILKKIDRLNDRQFTSTDLAVSNDRKKLAVQWGAGIFIIEIAAQEVIQKLGSSIRKFDFARFSPDSRYLALSSRIWDEIAIWDLQAGKQAKLLKSNIEGLINPGIYFSKDSKSLTSIYDNRFNQEKSGFWRWDIQSGKSVSTGKASYFAASPDEKTIAVKGNKDTVLIYDAATFSYQRSISGFLKKINLSVIDKRIARLAYSHNGMSLFISIEFKTSDENWHVALVEADAASGMVLQSSVVANDYSRFIDELSVSPDGNVLAATGRDENVYLWDASNLNGSALVIPTHDPDLRRSNREGVASQISYSPDSRIAALACRDNNIRLIDTKTGSLVQLIKGHNGAVVDVNYSADGKYLVSYSEDNTVRLWDAATGKEKAKLFSFLESDDWVVVSPDGRFDGNPSGMKRLYFNKGVATIPLESLFDNFYTPNLLPRILNGETFEPSPVDVNSLIAAPVVTISVEKDQRNLVVENDVLSIDSDKDLLTLKVNASCPSDAISEIRLFLNGKLLQTTRNLVVEDDVQVEKSVTRTFTVMLMPGENMFKATAFNTQRTESMPSEIIVNYKPLKPEPGTVANGIQLHLLVIGINAYKNPKYNLNYANADASAFKESLEIGSNTLFSKINTYYLKDAEATKAGISDVLNRIKTDAGQQDMFVFYYAGHGVLNDKKEFFLVPHDVTQLYGNDDALAQKGLSADQLQQYSKDIKAQKQLFILDACQSAGALDQVIASRGVAEEKAIAQLARATGTHWLTASGSEQFASEFSQLGHGTFTYVLLEALTGKADTGDKKITINEIDAYLQEQVPEVTNKFKGTPQYPASYGFGNDFPVKVMK